MNEYKNYYGQWFTMWYEDKQSIINCMISNMNSDLECGYDPNGKSITAQKRMITVYTNEFKNQQQILARMDEDSTEKWCYHDLKARGAI